MTVLQDARSALIRFGGYVMTHVDVARCLRIEGCEWSALVGQWDHLAPDPDDAETGTARFRRYGRFELRGQGSPMALPPDRRAPVCEHRPAPLTEEFSGQPLLGRLLGMLGWLACGLETPQRWIVSVHPMRVLTRGGPTRPTPGGVHRDGVTLVATLLVGTDNAVGGRSTVIREDGRPVLTTTMIDPGTLILGDDRRTLHGVSSVRPAEPDRPARRDLLVVTFAPG